VLEISNTWLSVTGCANCIVEYTTNVYAVYLFLFVCCDLSLFPLCYIYLTDVAVPVDVTTKYVVQTSLISCRFDALHYSAVATMITLWICLMTHSTVTVMDGNRDCNCARLSNMMERTEQEYSEEPSQDMWVHINNNQHMKKLKN